MEYSHEALMTLINECMTDEVIDASTLPASKLHVAFLQSNTDKLFAPQLIKKQEVALGKMKIQEMILNRKFNVTPNSWDWSILGCEGIDKVTEKLFTIGLSLRNETNIRERVLENMINDMLLQEAHIEALSNNIEDPIMSINYLIDQIYESILSDNFNPSNETFASSMLITSHLVRYGVVVQLAIGCQLVWNLYRKSFFDLIESKPYVVNSKGSGNLQKFKRLQEQLVSTTVSTPAIIEQVLTEMEKYVSTPLQHSFIFFARIVLSLAEGPKKEKDIQVKNVINLTSNLVDMWSDYLNLKTLSWTDYYKALSFKDSLSLPRNVNALQGIARFIQPNEVVSTLSSFRNSELVKS